MSEFQTPWLESNHPENAGLGWVGMHLKTLESRQQRAQACSFWNLALECYGFISSCHHITHREHWKGMTDQGEPLQLFLGSLIILICSYFFLCLKL